MKAKTYKYYLVKYFDTSYGCNDSEEYRTLKQARLFCRIAWVAKPTITEIIEVTTITKTRCKLK